MAEIIGYRKTYRIVLKSYKCSKCGKETEWDDSLGDPLCIECWDRASEKAAQKAYREKNPDKVAAAKKK